MTDRELLKQALDALNNYVGVVKSELNEHSWDTKIVDAGKPAREAIEAIRARLAQPEPVKVTPKEFIAAVTGKWGITGMPMMMSVWPEPEQLYKPFGLAFEAEQKEKNT
jgi:hypothetical protein